MPASIFPVATWICSALVLALSASGCAADPPPSRAGAEPSDGPFALEEPLASVELDAALREISGLALLDSLHLVAVQDERGTLYTIALATGEVTATAEFHGAGDFEGIARTDDGLFALQSDGDVFELDPDGRDARKYETALTRRCDAEGLGYDAAERQLLIACKAYPGEDLDGYRAVYAFDLASRSLLPTPRLLIDTRVAPGLRNFRPSAIAYHPPTGWWLLLSASNPVLAALDADGRLRGAWQLDARLLPQPEGLAVLPNGDLLVATEGRPARLVRYAYRS